MITPSTTISSPSSSLSIDPVVMLTPKFFNDFDITSNGKIIFTDSSYRNGRSENRVEILDGAPTGRVLMYDIYKKELTVIVCGLHFSNGVQLILNDKNYKSDSDNDNNNDDNDNDSEEVIVNDLVRFRALRINISSPYLISGEALQSCDEYGNTYQGTIYQYLYTLLIHHLSEIIISLYNHNINYYYYSCYSTLTYYIYVYIVLHNQSSSSSSEDRYSRSGIDFFIDPLPGLPDNVRVHPHRNKGILINFIIMLY